MGSTRSQDEQSDWLSSAEWRWQHVALVCAVFGFIMAPFAVLTYIELTYEQVDPCVMVKHELNTGSSVEVVVTAIEKKDICDAPYDLIHPHAMAVTDHEIKTYLWARENYSEDDIDWIISDIRSTYGRR